MELLSDLVLCTAMAGLTTYCFVLSRRLRRFTDLEHGVGGAVAILVAQVDDLKRTLIATKNTAQESTKSAKEQVTRAEAATRKLELLIASMSDLEAKPYQKTNIAKDSTRRDLMPEDMS